MVLRNNTLPTIYIAQTGVGSHSHMHSYEHSDSCTHKHTHVQTFTDREEVTNGFPPFLDYVLINLYKTENDNIRTHKHTYIQTDTNHARARTNAHTEKMLSMCFHLF